MKEGTAIAQVLTELERAQKAHRPMASAHEGYAVILEELAKSPGEVNHYRRRL